MNQEIFEGLRTAISRGESLKRAMMSFLNAGYGKAEIEQAAKVLQSQRISQPIQVQQSPIKPLAKKTLPIKKVSAYGKQPIPKQQPTQKKIKPVQLKKVTSQQPKVSDYKVQEKPKKNWILYLMIFFFVILLGVLAAVIFFKPELKEFVSTLFG
jgi:hypothetical protein